MNRITHEKGRLAVYHSDGAVQAVVEDIIGCGFDGLNPIEPKAMDINEMKRKYGSRISLLGNIDLIYTLTRGTPEEVRAEVRQRIHDLAPGGGYAVASAQLPSGICPPGELQRPARSDLRIREIPDCSIKGHNEFPASSRRQAGRFQGDDPGSPARVCPCGRKGVFMEFEPNFDRLRKAIRHEEPDRLPLIEALVAYEIQSQFLGRKVEDSDLKSQVEFWVKAGLRFLALDGGHDESGGSDPGVEHLPGRPEDLAQRGGRGDPLEYRRKRGDLWSRKTLIFSPGKKRPNWISASFTKSSPFFRRG